MGSIIGGAASVVGGLVNQGKLRREQTAARAQQQGDLDAVRNFEFTNVYKGLENTAEDLTVNQQATNVQAQQTDAALAQGLDAIVAGGGGGGSAQAIANAALQSKQGLSADIAAQESANQITRQKEASNLQAAAAQGEQDLQSQQYKQQGRNLDLSSSRLTAANDARAANRQQIIGGFGNIVGGVATGGLDGVGKAVKGLFGK